MRNIFKNAGSDISASVVVFLVALPLCLGIALGSGAPLFSGIIAGMVGGIVIGSLSGSQLSVSGPAAGLTAIVLAAIADIKDYQGFLVAVVLAGLIQLILGFLKAGIIGDYIPNSVIKGMLAAIGLILILKQFTHLVGYDKNYEGDESFVQADNENTFTGIFHALNAISAGACIIGLTSLIILILWEKKFIKRQKALSFVPGPLVVVLVAVFLNILFSKYFPGLELNGKRMVNLPKAENATQFMSFFTFPNLDFIKNVQVWIHGFTIAIVASLETLLGIEAVDKLDPFKRVTPTNRELKAQGVGNMVSGLIGGLPLTSVIVRSSANVMSGAKSKFSTIFHGVLLLVSVYFIPDILSLIPLSALAAILIFTGYKLARISLFKDFYRKGWDQFVPFVMTIVAILLTDLLIGIIVGILVGLFFMLRSNFKTSVSFVNDENGYLVKLRKDVSFLNKPFVKRTLESIPANSHLFIDATRADFIDKDIIEEINNFLVHAHLKNIKVEIKKSGHKSMHSLFNEPLKLSGI